VSLPLGVGLWECAVVALGLFVLAGAAALVAARQLGRERVVSGLRSD
jgi:hypothetical protein